MMTESTHTTPHAVTGSATAATAAPSRSATALALRAARCALQWRLLALWILVLLLPTAMAALPLWHVLGTSLDHSVYAPELAARLDMIEVADLVGALIRSGSAVAYGGMLALLSTLLLSPLLSGITVSAARAPQRPGFGALLAGGLQEYPRMLRMLLWSVVPLGLAATLAGVALNASNNYGRSAILEADASRADLIALCAAAVLVALAAATLDAGRAVLASDRRRRSAIVAWWHGFRLVRQRPLALFGVYLAVSAAGLALAALLAVARLNVAPLGAAGFAAAFVLTQLAVAALAWMRNARLFAMVELARSTPT